MSVIREARRLFGGAFLFQSRFWWGLGGWLTALAWLNASHYAPWLNFEAEAMALAGIVVCGSALAAARSTVEVPHISLVPLAFAFVVLAQWAAGLVQFGGDVVVAELYLFALIAAVTLGYQVGRARSGLADLTFSQIHAPNGVWLWGPALASATVGLLQWLGYSETLGVFGVGTPPGFRAIGNMAQPNQLATLLLFGVCAAWYDHERGTLGRVPLALLVAFLSVTIVLSQSRTALLSASALSFFISAKLRLTPGRWRTPWWVPLAWATSIWLLQLAAPSLYSALLLGTERTTSLTNLNLRQVIWHQMMHALAVAPWWGWGWNQTSIAQHASAHWHPGDISYSYAHNLALDLLVWFGLPVGSMLIGLLAWWFATRAKRVKTLAGVASFAGLVAMGIHSLLEFPFAYTYFLLTAGVLGGVVERDACGEIASGHWHVNRMSWLGAMCVTGMVGGLVAVEYVEAQDDFRVARFSSMRVGSAQTTHLTPRLRLLTQLDALLHATRIEPKRGMGAREIELLRLAAMRFSYEALDYKLVRALALNGDAVGATRHLETMRAMYGDAYHAILLADLENRSADFLEFVPLVSAFRNPSHFSPHP